MAQRRYRCSWDDIARLDADHLSSWGAYEPGKLATVEFEGEHLPTRTMVFETQQTGDRFHAFYEWKVDRRADPVTVRSVVLLERRACPFGGTRTYFIAPCCGRSVLRLAALEAGLRCATCGGITWTSRRERPVHRAIRKASKLANELGCASWRDRPKARPKYMRLLKFELLQARRRRLVGQISDHLKSQIARKGLLR
jgi:hypothetical protein